MAGERWIGIGEESAYGTENATIARHMRAIDFDATHEPGLMADFETADFMKEFAVTGPLVGSGRLTAYARPDVIGHFLKWALGKVTTTQYNTTEMYDHVFEIDPANLKSFSLTDARNGITQDRRLLGTVIKSFTLEAAARERVTFELDLQYQWEKLITDETMGTLSALRPFVFFDGAVSLDGSPLANVEAFRLVYNNSIPDDTHEIGSRKLPSIEHEGVELTVEMDMKFKSWAMRQNFFQGSGSPTEPQDEARYFTLDLVLTGEPTGVAGRDNYKLNIDLNKLILKENPVPISRRDRLTQRAVFEALKGTGDQITLWNKETSY